MYYLSGRVGPNHIVGPVSEPSTSTPPPPIPSPPQPAVLLQPPSGAGGFAFGETEDEARQACEQGGHAYATVTASKAACDGVIADVGAPARAALTYCDGRICAVSLQVPLAPSDDAAHALVHWRSVLVSKYGGPSESQTDVPDRCDHDVTPCLLDGTGTIQFDWRWPNRQGTTLGLHLDDARRAWMDIAYTAPPSSPEAAGL